MYGRRVRSARSALLHSRRSCRCSAPTLTAVMGAGSVLGALAAGPRRRVSDGLLVGSAALLAKALRRSELRRVRDTRPRPDRQHGPRLAALHLATRRARPRTRPQPCARAAAAMTRRSVLRGASPGLLARDSRSWRSPARPRDRTRITSASRHLRSEIIGVPGLSLAQVRQAPRPAIRANEVRTAPTARRLPRPKCRCGNLGGTWGVVVGCRGHR
jgi:hypothetical protein